MVYKRPKETPEIAWQIGSGMVPDSIRKVLDQKFITIKGADINGWSLIHFLIGGLFYFMKISLLWANIAHAGWEVFQAYFNVTDLSLSSEWYDTLFDTLFFNLGYFTCAVLLSGQSLKQKFNL